MYKVQICYSNFLENKLFIFLNYEFFFSQAQKTNKQTKAKATTQRKLEISNYDMQLKFEISSYIQFYCFYVTCMLYVSITDKTAKPKIFTKLFKKYE